METLPGFTEECADAAVLVDAPAPRAALAFDLPLGFPLPEEAVEVPLLVAEDRADEEFEPDVLELGLV